MPHLVFAGRYWRFAGDEIFLPGFCAMFWRLVWSSLLVIIIAVTFNGISTCSDGWLILSYLFVSLGSFLLAIFCEVALIVVSLKGTMVQAEEREPINFYLAVHVVLGVIQMLSAIFGVVLIAAHSGIPCEKHLTSGAIKTILAAVVFSQLVDALSLLCCCYVLAAQRVSDELRPSKSLTATDYIEETVGTGLMHLEQRWEARCRSLCRSIQICSCNMFGGGSIAEDLEAVAKVLTHFFQNDGLLDVVASDVAAGILLTRHQQRDDSQRHTGTMSPMLMHTDGHAMAGDIEQGRVDDHDGAATMTTTTSTSMTALQHSASREEYLDLVPDREVATFKHHRVRGRRVLSRNITSDRALMQKASVFALYALSAYSHLILLYMKPATGLCRLCSHTRCAAGCCSCCCSAHAHGAGAGAKRKSSSDSEDDGELHHLLGREQITGDNTCGAHRAALAEILRSRRHCELLYASFVNDTLAKPFAVLLDHDEQAVVVTIRGTLSLEDCVTDCIVEPVSMEAAGARWGVDGRGRWAHKGMLQAALHLREELERLQLLTFVLRGESYQTMSTEPSHSHHHMQPMAVSTRTPSPSNSTIHTPLNRV